MPSSGLLVIKKRIESVKNTQKITRAMALIAKSKLRKSKNKLLYSDLYFRKLDEIMQNAISSSDDLMQSRFCKSNDASKTLYIVFASNTGFCGGFNASSAIYLNEKYSKEERRNIDVISIGSRANSYLKRYDFNVIEVESRLKDDINIDIAKNLADKIVNFYLNDEYKEIIFLFTKFKSQTEQNISQVKVLPLIFRNEENLNVFDVCINEDDFVSGYIEGAIVHSFNSSLNSEESARMQSMDCATRNAQEIIDGLNSKYNRIRQAAITQEISEIVGGAQAQK